MNDRATIMGAAFGNSLIIAIDVFLRGCTNKQAALIAMDKNPTTLDIAIQYMKSAITNQKLILGLRKCDTLTSPIEYREGKMAKVEPLDKTKPHGHSTVHCSGPIRMECFHYRVLVLQTEYFRNALFQISLLD